MSDIKWIKITTDMFDDEKIDFIASLPDADAIIVIWIRLLTLAGKCNAGGYIYLTEKIPYTEEMLAHKFKKQLSTVKMALETFRRLDMLDMEDNTFFLPNWGKHQNIDGMDKIREQTRKRVAAHRSKKSLELPSGNATCNVTGNGDVTQGNAIELDIDIQEEEGPRTAMDAYRFSFNKIMYTGHIHGYVMDLMKRGFTDAFVREVFLEMGARGANPDVNYMRKLAEDWISKGIYTRIESERRRKQSNVPSEREAEIQQQRAEERKNNVIEMIHKPDPILDKAVGLDD